MWISTSLESGNDFLVWLFLIEFQELIILENLSLGEIQQTPCEDLV